jgi:hypothetical protein
MHLRMASEDRGLTRRDLITGLSLCAATACRGGTGGSGDPSIAWAVQPAQPDIHSDTVIRLHVTDDDGLPVNGATVRIEAHMSHPGMTPVLATATEQPDGTYEAALRFSMAGPWSLVATGTERNGRHIAAHTHRVDVQAD